MVYVCVFVCVHACASLPADEWNANFAEVSATSPVTAKDYHIIVFIGERPGLYLCLWLWSHKYLLSGNQKMKLWTEY